MERIKPLALTPTTIYMRQKLLKVSHVKRYSLYREVQSGHQQIQGRQGSLLIQTPAYSIFDVENGL